MLAEINNLNTGLLSKEEFAEIKDLLPEIRRDFESRPLFRTEVEARISVLNELHFPTPHARYWQSVREQQVHFEELISLSFEYRRKQIQLEELEAELEKEKSLLGLFRRNSRKARLLEIDIEQKRFEILCAEKVAKERVREIKQWSKIKGEEKEKDKSLCTETADGLAQLKSYCEEFIAELLNSGNNIPPADAQNLIGKALSAKNECVRLGVWDDVRSKLKLNKVQEQVLKQVGIL